MLHDQLVLFSPFRGTFRGTRYTAHGKTQLFDISRDEFEINVIYICCGIVQSDPENVVYKSVSVESDSTVTMELDVEDTRMRLEEGFVYTITITEVRHQDFMGHPFGGFVLKAKLAF